MLQLFSAITHQTVPQITWWDGASSHRRAWASPGAAWTHRCRCSDTPWRVWGLPVDRAHRWRPKVWAKDHQGASDLRKTETILHRDDSKILYYWKMEKASLLTGEDLESYLCKCGQSRLVEHTDAAHFLNFGWVHSFPSNWFEDVPYRRRLLKCPLEEVCQRPSAYQQFWTTFSLTDSTKLKPVKQSCFTYF